MKKILSIVLVLLMTLSIFAMTGCEDAQNANIATADEAVASIDEAGISTVDEAPTATNDQASVTFDFVTSTELYINWITKNGTPMTGVVGLEYNEEEKVVSFSMLYEDKSKIFDISASEDKVRLEVSIPKTEITLATEILY